MYVRIVCIVCIECIAHTYVVVILRGIFLCISYSMYEYPFKVCCSRNAVLMIAALLSLNQLCISAAAHLDRM